MIVGYECLLTGPSESGVGIAARELLQRLTVVRDDVKVVVFASPKSDCGLPREERVDYRISRFAGVCRATRVVWQQAVPPRFGRGHIDLYHATGYILSSLKFRVPTVLSIYDTTALEHPHLTRWANACHFKFAVPPGARAASMIIVPSRYVANRLEAFLDIGPDRVCVIPLGVAAEFKVRSGAECPSELQVPYLLFVGNLERKKNLLLLVRVLAELRKRGWNVRLVLAGSAGNAAGSIAAMAKAEGVQEAIVFTGYVNRAALVTLYQGAAMLLYPSLDEGFGLPPLEAMACGAPVVASNAGAIPEVTAGAAILLEPADVRGWLEAIEAVMTNPSHRGKLCEMGLKRASEFSWQRTARHVIGVYEKTIAREAKRLWAQ